MNPIFGILMEGIIVNEGMATCAKILTSDVGETAWDYIGIGTGTTGPAVGNTWLETEDQVSAATGTVETETVTDDTMQLIVDAFTFAGVTAVTESIVANASTDGGGECLCRQTFTAVNVTASDELKVTWRVTVQQGS